MYFRFRCNLAKQELDSDGLGVLRNACRRYLRFVAFKIFINFVNDLSLVSSSS